MSAKTIIAATTDAVTAEVIVDLSGAKGEFNLFAVGLATTEEIDIFMRESVGATAGGVFAHLTASISSIVITAPAILGIKKDSTVATTGVFIFSPVEVS